MIDMYFYKERFATENSAVIKKEENDDTGGDKCGVVGRLSEFKFDVGNMKSPKFLQT